MGNTDRRYIGGLVGLQNGGNITASYATGNVLAKAGEYNNVGGLVGLQNGGSITASYAIGNADGGSGINDEVGSLVGAQQNSGTSIVSASFGFGTPTNGTDSMLGTSIATQTGWTSTSGVNDLTLAIANDPDDGDPTDTTNDNKWDSASNNTKDAWDFGTSNQAPALKYADYDGTGTMFHCESDADNVPTGAILIPNCGELIPGQR